MSAVVTADDEAENLYVKACQRVVQLTDARQGGRRRDATQPGRGGAARAACFVLYPAGWRGSGRTSLRGPLRLSDHDALSSSTPPPSAFMVET